MICYLEVVYYKHKILRVLDAVNSEVTYNFIMTTLANKCDQHGLILYLFYCAGLWGFKQEFICHEESSTDLTVAIVASGGEYSEITKPAALCTHILFTS